jgi:hypothetical protein
MDMAIHYFRGRGGVIGVRFFSKYMLIIREKYIP